MTSKEKAQELFDKMHIEIYNRDMYDDLFRAKQCALIAVDEIIKASPTNPLKSRYIELYSDMVDESTEYWEEVKKEIEAL